MNNLIKITKDDRVIEVSELTLDAHLKLGWAKMVGVSTTAPQLGAEPESPADPDKEKKPARRKKAEEKAAEG